jgi:hypothetical protein
MIAWTDIIQSADDAKLKMVSDRGDGEKNFEFVLNQNPRKE